MDETIAEIDDGIIPWTYDYYMINCENKNHFLEDHTLRKAILKRREIMREKNTVFSLYVNGKQDIFLLLLKSK